MKHLLLIAFSIFLLSSCSSGSYILTGQKREPTNPDSIKLYTSFPPKYEVIGIVNASGSGWSQQDDMNLAVIELKKQAAKLGANGILLTTVGEINSPTVSTSTSGVTYTSSSKERTVTGQAIYVWNQVNTK